MDILYQDNSILVCIKPAGVLSTDEPGGMPELVRQTLGDPKACVRTVHRLDRVVSGLMVLARTPGAASSSRRRSASTTSARHIWPSCTGAPRARSRALTVTCCRRDPNERKTYVTDRMAKGVQEAVLDYEVLGTRAELSLVRIYLQTGRTHQIRCQFSSRGLPLWGDRKYSTLPDDGPIALWSHCLHFAHPETGEVLYFEQQPPDCYPWDRFTELDDWNLPALPRGEDFYANQRRCPIKCLANDTMSRYNVHKLPVTVRIFNAETIT